MKPRNSTFAPSDCASSQAKSVKSRSVKSRSISTSPLRDDPRELSEEGRLRALARYDSDESLRQWARVGIPELDRLARLMSKALNADGAFVALIDQNRVFTLGRFEFDDLEWPRENSLCDWTIALGNESHPVFQVTDLTSDHKMNRKAFLRDGRAVSAQAAAPLRSAGHHCIGVVSVLFAQPHEISGAQSQMLCEFAQMALDALDLRVQRLRFRLDLAERDRLNNQLFAARRENFLLRAAVKSSSAGIIITEPILGDNQIVYANPAFQRMSGYSEQELLGLNCRFLQGPKTSRETVAQLREAIEKGQEIEVTLVNYNRQGEPFWNNLTINPVRDENNEILAFVGVQQDVTRRKEMEDALQTAKEELEDRVQKRTNDLQRLTGVLMGEVETQKKLTAQLEASRTQIRALGARLEELREEERKRIAREIHDELGQLLTHLKMEMGFLSREWGHALPELPPRLESVKEQLDNAIHSVRRIASDLRPSILDRLGLCEAISWLGSEFQNVTGIRVQVDAPLDDTKIGADRVTALFRITQEALTNVARHSQAQRVSIELWHQHGHLHLQIVDDGIGCSPAHERGRPDSLGLLGIEERAMQLDGALQIEPSSPENHERPGTKLHVKLPLERRRREENKPISK